MQFGGIQGHLYSMDVVSSEAMERGGRHQQR